MIENELKRIADALEKLANGQERPALAQAAPPPAVEPVKEPDKPRRGRPPKAETPSPAPAPEPVAEPDIPAESDPMDFLADESPAEVTVDMVRASLIDYQKRVSPEKARKLLKDVGGVDTLVSLKPEKYRAVYEAASK